MSFSRRTIRNEHPDHCPHHAFGADFPTTVSANLRAAQEPNDEVLDKLSDLYTKISATAEPTGKRKTKNTLMGWGQR